MSPIIKLRTTILFIFFCLVYSIIIIHLFRIQLVSHQLYLKLGEKQYLGLYTQAPPRAAIYDRNGTPLALNQECISAFIVPKQIKDFDALSTFLKRHFSTAYVQLTRNMNKQFLFIKRHLTQEQLALIQSAHLTDIKFLNEPYRFYPVSAAAPIVGIVDIDGNGAMGIELAYNDTLAGTPSTHFLEKDARSGNFYFTRETKKSGSEGTPVHLTIDSNLQFLVRDAVKKTVEKYRAKEGYALVMNPDDGAIIAMVTYPHFDPNNTEQLDLDATKNKVITNAYELGSVIKTFAALAALEEGVVTPDELIDCKNLKTAYINGRKINTWKAHSLLAFTDVVGLSNNIGTAIVAKRVDTRLYDHYTRLGFGKKTGIEFPGENPGFVNHPDNWSKQSIISLSYGYEISATLLQLACALAIIANDGYPITPTLLLESIHAIDTSKAPLYTQASLSTIRSILEHTTEHGTAKRAHIKGYNIMSKTGTAILLTNGVYDESRNLFTCSGIIQKGSYKRIVVTCVNEVESPVQLYASQVAAPLFEQVTQHILIHDRII